MPEGVTSVTMGEVALPRFEDGTINLQELLRRLAEDVADEVMCAEADQMCALRGTSRNGYRMRKPVACVGEPAPGVPKLREGTFFPDDLPGRYGRADCAVVATVSETCATGTSPGYARDTDDGRSPAQEGVVGFAAEGAPLARRHIT